MADENPPREDLYEAAEDLLDEVEGPQPSWDRVVRLAVRVMRGAAAAIHDPHESEIDAATVARVEGEIRQTLDEQVRKALDAAIDSFDGSDAVITGAILCVEGLDVATTPFRAVRGSPGEQLDLLVNLAGYGYQTLLAETPTQSSTN